MDLQDFRKNGALSPETIDALRARGVRTLEETLALAAALRQRMPSDGGEGGRMLAELFDLLRQQDLPLDQTRLLRLREAAPTPRFFGLRLTKTDIARAEDPARLFRLSRPDAPPPPPAARLLGRMQPVRDQGERGACVAFASVALREYYAGDDARLSEQFFYWAGKECDGMDEEGMTLETAVQVFGQRGVCTAARWPYNPLPCGDGGADSQGPPPPGAEEEARCYLLPGTRVYHNKNRAETVLWMKRMLAGRPGVNPGRPIVIGAILYADVTSQETLRTGVMTLPLLPLPFLCLGGHAMCVVGYVDDKAAPGGGWFIVRNSWGEQWARESPEAPGHAMMPYAYLETEYVPLFLTGPENVDEAGRRAGSAANVERDPFAERFCRVLQKDAQDAEGRLRPRGQRVVGHPESAHFMDDTPANRSAFVVGGFCWEPESPRAGLIAKAADSRENAAARKRFLDALDVNLLSATGGRMPGERKGLFGKEPRFAFAERVDIPADILARHFEGLRRIADIPEGLCAEWREELHRVNPLRLYRLSGPPGDYLAVVAWFTPLVWREARGPEACAPHADHAALLRKVAAAYTDQARGKWLFTGCAVGFCGAPCADLRAPQTASFCLTPSAYTPEGRRATASFPASGAPDHWSFWDRLVPDTWAGMAAAVQAELDELDRQVFFGSLSPEKLSELTGIRPAVVAELFETIAQRGEYALVGKGPDARLEKKKA